MYIWYIQAMRCEVVWRPLKGHTYDIGVWALRGMMSDFELIKEVDSVHTYVEYLV